MKKSMLTLLRDLYELTCEDEQILLHSLVIDQHFNKYW